MKEKQQKLRQLLATERLHSSPPTSPLQSPHHIILTRDLPPWSQTTPTTKPGPRSFPYDRHLNQIVSLHKGSITSLECDAMVMPLSSCYRPELESENGEVMYTIVIPMHLMLVCVFCCLYIYISWFVIMKLMIGLL